MGLAFVHQNLTLSNLGGITVNRISNNFFFCKEVTLKTNSDNKQPQLF